MFCTTTTSSGATVAGVTLPPPPVPPLIGTSRGAQAATANTITRYDPAADAFQLLAGPGSGLFAGSGVDDGLLQPGYPAFEADGGLLFCDTGHKQVKRVPASAL